MARSFQCQPNLFMIETRAQVAFEGLCLDVVDSALVRVTKISRHVADWAAILGPFEWVNELAEARCMVTFHEVPDLLQHLFGIVPLPRSSTMVKPCGHASCHSTGCFSRLPSS